MRATAHTEAAQIVWLRCRFTRRSLVRCVSTITGLHVSVDCQRDLVRAIGVAADDLGQRDDCYDLAMDIIQGLRFHMYLVGSGCWTTWLPRNCVQVLHLDTRHKLVRHWHPRVVDGAAVLLSSATPVLRRACRRAMEAWMQRRTSGSRSGMCQKRPAMSTGRETRTLSHEGWA